MNNASRSKVRVFILLFCGLAIIFGFYLLGFYMGKPHAHSSAPDTTISEVQASSRQRLLISAQISHQQGNTHLSLPNSTHTVLLSNLYDVRIALADGTHDLKDALTNGLVTPEEIICWAKQDAAQGVCKEIFSSKNGLSHFIYRYAQLELSVFDDVYETPDGQQHRIWDLTIRESGGNNSGLSLSYLDENGERKNIDREDWGLTFTAERVDEHTLRLTCIQSGGQQLGQLEIVGLAVYYTDLDSSVCDSSDVFQITANSITTIDLGCTGLPAGTYNMRLLIKDRFDPDQVHTLMRDFEDSQYHSVVFSLP